MPRWGFSSSNSIAGWVTADRPEPAQIGGAGAGLVDAADAPRAAEDAVVDIILVGTMAKAGRAHLEGHQHSTFRRSPQDFRLGQVEPRLQLPPLCCSLSSRRKEVTRAPPRMAVQDVPFKRTVSARMPPHVEKPFFHLPQSSSASRLTALQAGGPSCRRQPARRRGAPGVRPSVLLRRPHICRSRWGFDAGGDDWTIGCCAGAARGRSLRWVDRGIPCSAAIGDEQIFVLVALGGAARRVACRSNNAQQCRARSS